MQVSATVFLPSFRWAGRRESSCETGSVFHLNAEVQPQGYFCIATVSGLGEGWSLRSQSFLKLRLLQGANYLSGNLSSSVSLTLLSLCLSPSLCLFLDELLLVKKVWSSEVGNEKTEPYGWAASSIFPAKV